MATASADEDLSNYSPPSRCSKHGPEIRFPLQLESSKPYTSSSLCGSPCIKLACSGQDTILVDPVLAPYKVIAVDYRSATLTIIPRLNYSPCCLIANFMSASSMIPNDIDYPGYTFYSGFAVHCLKKFTPSTDGDYIVGPIFCLSNATHFFYLVYARADMSILPLDCKAVSNGTIPIPVADIMPYTTFKEQVEMILNNAAMTVGWWIHEEYEPEFAFSGTQCGRQTGFSTFTSLFRLLSVVHSSSLNSFCQYQGEGGSGASSCRGSALRQGPLLKQTVRQDGDGEKQFWCRVVREWDR